MNDKIKQLIDLRILSMDKAYTDSYDIKRAKEDILQSINELKSLCSLSDDDILDKFLEIPLSHEQIVKYYRSHREFPNK